jgi:predicted ATP-binding protein involved in virulence
MNAFIVTNGDVKISGNVKFKGNIIAKGNLIIENGTSVTIEYDKKTAEDIQENYGDVFAAIFGQFEVIDKTDEESTDKTELKHLLDGQYDIKRYLEKKLWKLNL